MNPFLVKNVFFPIYEKIRGWDTLKCLKELRKTQWYPEEKIKEYQWRKLKSLLQHAYDNVPYYRNMFKKLKIHPNDISSFQDFKKIPCLTKKDIKKDINSFISKDARKRGMIKMNTGGSTGEPLIFYVDKRRISYDRASHIRAREWWGIDVGDREIVLWGSPIETTSQDRIKDIRDWFFNTKLLSAFKTSEEKMIKYAKIIKHFNPRHIFGYGSSIYLFCKTMMKKGIYLKNLDVKVVFVTADMLYDHHRKLIEEYFKCPVANGYGSRDGGFIAHECPEGNMHLTENIYVEILNNGKEVNYGEMGEVVITHLDNYTMPFIRYRTGDWAILSKKSCSCGRKLEIMESIEGRTTDFITTSKGKVMHALSLIYILRDIEGIEAFKIIQKRLDHLEIEIVRNNYFSFKSEEKIRKKIVQVMEDRNVKIDFKYPDHIKMEPSGKHRYVVSKVTCEKNFSQKG